MFPALLALIWHFVILIALLCLAVAWFLFGTGGKKFALLASMCLIVGLLFATTYTYLGARYVEKKWDASNAAQSAKAERAREDAEAYFPPAVNGVPAKRVWGDKNDRDNGFSKVSPVVVPLPKPKPPGLISRAKSFQANHLLKLKGYFGNSPASPRP